MLRESIDKKKKLQGPIEAWPSLDPSVSSPYFQIFSSPVDPHRQFNSGRCYFAGREGNV